MQEDEKWLLEETQANFNLDKKNFLLEAIFRGGSDRSYYRLWRDGKPFCILMHYGDEKEENHYYAEIAQFLKEIKIPAPEILNHDAQKKLIWMQDLGEVDLYAQRELPWQQRRKGYRAVLEIIRHLHDEGLAALQKKTVRMMEGFDERLYRWEQNYFWEQTAQEVFGIHPASEKKNKAQEELDALNRRLCALPSCLVHRDFQSHNIMLVDNTPHLIDFQGMRTGTRFYDLGSLLFDPYVELTDEQRLDLLKFYYGLGKNDLDWTRFEHAFYEASMQRLMQALGAYGFLGLKRKKKQFLKFIPSALEHLGDAIEKSGNFSEFKKIVSNLKQACCNIEPEGVRL